MARLTHNNYHGPPVHERATAKSRQYPSVPNTVVRESRRNGLLGGRAVPAAPQRETSIEIDAQPLSSADEEEQEQKEAEPTPKTRRIQEGFKDTDDKILRRQRCLREGKAAAKPPNGHSNGTRQARRKPAVDDPMETTTVHETGENKTADELSEEEARMRSWHEHAAKKRKLPPSKTYHSARVVNIHTSIGGMTREAGFQPVPAILSPRRSGRHAESGFQAPEGLKSPGLGKSRTAGFAMPTEDSRTNRRKTRSEIRAQEQAFRLPDEMPAPTFVTSHDAVFQLPADSTTSSATTTDQAPTVFSHPDSPPLLRSQSVSSLSSVDSIASLLLTQDEKDELLRDNHALEPSPTGLTARCPLCSHPVSNAQLEEFTIRFSRKSQTRLPSRLQQRFCREHRAQTARETWQERGYPDIDWAKLASTRITHHLPDMRSILHNSTPSFYRDRLAEATTSITTQAGAGGRGRSRRTLLKYLKEGVLDVVRYGYYGPRGAKVAAEAITLALSTDLVQAAARDAVVREAGAAGFVQAVLVPEMVGRWVAEDRGWGRPGGEGCQEQVRKVLEESAEVGRLVNEDEDRVVLSTREGSGGGMGGYGDPILR